MGADFDGVDQSIDLGTGVNWGSGLDAVSLTCCVNVDVVTDARFFNKSLNTSDAGQTMKLGYTGGGGGQTGHIIDGDAVAGAPDPDTAKWMFLAVTYDGTTVRGYIGDPTTGVLTEVDTAAKTGNVGTNARNTRIGSTGHDTGARNVNGKGADVRVWDEFLSVAALLTIMAAYGHDGMVPRHRWILNEREPGATIGAGVIINSGAVDLAAGGGTNDPTWFEDALVTRRRYR